MRNHYTWLEENLQTFFNELGVKHNNGIIVAHGDKCYGYKDIWEEEGIEFEHGVAVYLLSFIFPWSETCRNTRNGFKPPYKWVIETYKEIKHLLPSIQEVK